MYNTMAIVISYRLNICMDQVVAVYVSVCVCVFKVSNKIINSPYAYIIQVK